MSYIPFYSLLYIYGWVPYSFPDFIVIHLMDCHRIIEPTILLNPPLDSDIMTEEIFGPLLPIITVRSN